MWVEFDTYSQASAYLDKIQEFRRKGTAAVETGSYQYNPAPPVYSPKEISITISTEGDIDATSPNRSPAKDALAKAILYGGWAAAKSVLRTLAVGTSVIDKATGKQLYKMACRMEPHMKKKAWEHYEKTGNILEMIEIAAGSNY